MEEVWVEKYRPKTLDEVVGQDHIVERLKAYVKQKSMPHLLFSGPPGVGKTACAISLARETFGENWSSNFVELNASDERGINVVREKIKNFARTAPIGAGFRIIFLDEADALTPDAQSALRRTMEMYTRTCRFILSCNYSSKIIEPIQSRCAIYRFKPISDDAIEKRLSYIAKCEKITITPDGMRAIVYVASGDMRRAVNVLQAAAMLTKKIDVETIYDVASFVRPEKMEELVKTALAGDFLSARKILDSFMLEDGLAGDDILLQLHRVLTQIELPERLRIELMDRVGEADFRLTEGANERIQLEALLASFVSLGKHAGKD
ncbi:replication factor C small subunit [Methanosarcinales archaeon]|nr:MAG: replication factor C small subunit [Methanosarcinales archaeon]